MKGRIFVSSITQIKSTMYQEFIHSDQDCYVLHLYALNGQIVARQVEGENGNWIERFDDSISLDSCDKIYRKYHALISIAGNWDLVATDEDFFSQIDGREYIGSFDTAAEAGKAIDDYRFDEHANNTLVEQVTNPDIQPPIR
jgi:hypothetical protein